MLGPTQSSHSSETQKRRDEVVAIVINTYLRTYW